MYILYMKINEFSWSRDYGEAQEFLDKYKAKHGKHIYPWVSVYYGMLSRRNGYSKRDKKTYSNIDVDIKSSELKKLFMRDRAWEMKQPSIDRINPDKGYVYNNLRWIEFSKNRKLRYMTSRKEKYNEGKKILDRWFRSTGWKNHLIRCFILKYLKDSRLSKSKYLRI